MSNKGDKKVCWNCGRDRQRCRAVSVTAEGEIEWYCPECYRNLDMKSYVSGESPKGYGHGV